MVKKVTVFKKPDKSDAFTIVLKSPTNVTSDTGYVVNKIDGLGPVDADINTTEMVVDGDNFNSARTGKRNIVFELEFFSNVGDGIEGVRHHSYTLFPTKKPIFLEVETSGRTAYTQGYVEKNEPDIFTDREGNQVSIICPDPKWYDSNGTQMTEITTGTDTVIEYTGNVEVGGYLAIEIGADVLAPVSEGVPAFTVSCVSEDGDAQLFHIYTPYDEDEGITGFVQGDIIVISSIPGNKYCIWTDTADADHNALNLIDQNPDWITIKPGINTIRVEDPNSAISSVGFENPICYEGV